jgi:hypothetical protein
MKEKARQYKPSTIRKLDTLSGNQCASPDSLNSLIASDDETIISKICHIEAANKNGPRFNAGMSDDERRHFDNLILLCDECHSIIDNNENEPKYPATLLKEWKRNHESKRLSQLNRNPSLLKHAINAIAKAELDHDNIEPIETFRAFKIENKIQYNLIKRNKSLIDGFKIFYSKINSLYNELEKQGSFKKNNLLRNVWKIYLKVKGNYVEGSENPMQVIRANADNIIEDVEDKIIELVEKDGEFYHEDISFGISIIMVDAFIRCKILEEPE